MCEELEKSIYSMAKQVRNGFVDKEQMKMHILDLCNDYRGNNIITKYEILDYILLFNQLCRNK